MRNKPTVSAELADVLVPLEVSGYIGGMAGKLAVAERDEDLVCDSVARQIDPDIAHDRAVDFTAPKIGARTKALRASPAARREAGSGVAALQANLAFHETGRAAAATNTICAEQAMAAIAPVTGALASHRSDGREFDRLQ